MAIIAKIDLVKSLCREAGDLLQAAFNKTVPSKSKQVTKLPEIEMRLLYLVAAFIQKNFPGDRLYGQDETADFKGNVWVCDPVDGSYFFTHGIPLYTFSLSLLKDGKPVLTAIYQPVGDRMYEAEKGKGASLNGRKLVISSANHSLEKRLVILSSNQGMNLGNLYNDLLKLGSKTIVTYSSIQHGAYVATGEVSALIIGLSKIQDMAPVALIVTEAGGVVTDLHGNKLDIFGQGSHGMIATSPNLFSQIQTTVSRSLT